MQTNNKKSNTHWMKFEQFGAFYRVFNHQLYKAPIADTGKMDKGSLSNPVVVTTIVEEERDNDFLETLNEKLGSNFEYHEFKNKINV